MKAISFLVLLVIASLGRAFATEQVVGGVPHGKHLRVWFEVHDVHLYNVSADALIETEYLNHPFTSLRRGDEVIRRWQGAFAAESLIKYEPEHKWWITSAMRLLSEGEYIAFVQGMSYRIPHKPFPQSCWGDSNTSESGIRAFVDPSGCSMALSGFGMHNLAAITLGALPREGETVVYYGRSGFISHETVIVWPHGKYTIRGTLGYGTHVTNSYGTMSVSTNLAPLEELTTADSIVGVVHRVVYNLSGREGDLLTALSR